MGYLKRSKLLPSVKGSVWDSLYWGYNGKLHAVFPRTILVVPLTKELFCVGDFIPFSISLIEKISLENSESGLPLGEATSLSSRCYRALRCHKRKVKCLGVWELRINRSEFLGMLSKGASTDTESWFPFWKDIRDKDHSYSWVPYLSFWLPSVPAVLWASPEQIVITEMPMRFQRLGVIHLPGT